MALTRALITALEDEDEPLEKRLRIADSAFRSTEISSQKCQSALINWLLKRSKSKDVEKWNLLSKWLVSQQTGSFSRSSVTQDVIVLVLKELANCFVNLESCDADLHEAAVNTLKSILNSSVFQQYFNHHLEAYCTTIAVALLNIQNEDNVMDLLKNANTFPKAMTSNESFCSNFVEMLVIPLLKLSTKFEAKSNITKAISEIFEKCLFNRTHDQFSAYLHQFFNNGQKEEDNPFNVLLEIFMSLCSREFELVKCGLKLFLQSLWSFYSNNFKEIYKFCVILMYRLGFDVEEEFHLNNTDILQNDTLLSNSLSVLAEVFAVLSELNCSCDSTVNEISFTNFLKTILLSIMNLTQTPTDVYSIMINIFVINPLIAEQLMSEISIYLMVKPTVSLETKEDHEKLLTHIFQIFAKLHRIEKLIAIMAIALKSGFEGSHKSEKALYFFCGQNDLTGKSATESTLDVVLSDSVLHCLSQHITVLANWQVINVFKSFLYHLNAALDSINKDENCVRYIEILGALFCCFLMSIKIAEHTQMLLEKFVKVMDDLKLFLAKFGVFLLNKEHNHTLMRAYLNMCYSKSELYLLLTFYCSDANIPAAKIVDPDCSSCNLTYLHDYLSREQWCTISQRITNFGEVPCKVVMHKLYLQKLKAMHVFKEACYAEAKACVVQSVSGEIKEIWKAMLQDQFFLNHILKEMDLQTILFLGECVLKEALRDEGYLTNAALIHCDVLMKAVLYNVLKIHKLFKQKRKMDDGVTKSFCCELFSRIDEGAFIYNGDLETATQAFNKLLLQEYNVTYSINFEKLEGYLKVVKKIPVLSFADSHQKMVLFYLVALLQDCRSNSVKEELLVKIEHIITGILQYNPILLVQNLPIDVLFEKSFTLFIRWDVVLVSVLRSALKNEEILKKLEQGVKYMLTLEDHHFLQWAVQFLDIMNKKGKMSADGREQLKKYKQQICERLCSILEPFDPQKSVEAYSYVLRYYLSQYQEKSSDFLQKMLKQYLDSAIDNIVLGKNVKSCLQVLVTVLNRKSKLKDFDESLTLKMWEVCKQIGNDEDICEEHSELHKLIFMFVSNEDFIIVTKDVLQVTADAFRNVNFQQIVYYLKIWSALTTCSFNPVKTKIWQNALEELLKEQYTFLLQQQETTPLQEITAFLTRLVQFVQLPFSAAMINLTLSTVSPLTTQNFTETFPQSISIMYSLLKYRNPLIMDLLPSYLQLYRQLLRELCARGHADLNLSSSEVQAVANCAHQLEKLTTALVSNGKHVMRLVPYVIADFLNMYERFNLYHDVKINLNNCLYSLVSLCDQHAIAYLMRVLSVASTELFKIVVEHYKKHRFTGKV